MAEEPTADPTEEVTADEVTELIDAPQPARDDARQRAQACAAQIDEALAQHRCCIMPRIDPSAIEPVGVAGDKVQITATYGILPLA